MTDAEQMQQTVLDLDGIRTDHADHSATDLMAGLFRACRDIEGGIAQVYDLMRNRAGARPLFDAMMALNPMAARFHADMLVGVSQRATRSFAPLLDNEDTALDARASADIVAWINTASQTLVALKVLVESSLLTGTALNGKPIETELSLARTRAARISPAPGRHVSRPHPGGTYLARTRAACILARNRAA